MFHAEKEPGPQDPRRPRRQGYTISIEEKLPGVVGVAAPIRHYTCPAILGVVGPEHRMRARTGEVVREVLASVRDVSENVRRSTNGFDAGFCP